MDEDAPRSPTLESFLPRRGIRFDLTTLSVIDALDESGAGRLPAVELAPGRGEETFSMVAFRGDLYYAASRRRVVARTPGAGGPTIELTSSGASPYAVAVDASGVYGLTGAGELFRVGHEGGAPTLVAAGLGGAHGLAVDEDALYVTDERGGRVLRVAKEGGPPLVLAARQGAPLDVATDGDHVVWTNGGAVAGASRWGGPSVVIADGQRRPHGVAVDGTHVYWVTPRAVRRAPVEGGAAEVLFEGLRFGWAIAVAGSHAVVAVPEAGAVLAIPVEGGPPRLVAARAGKPEAVAADEAFAYWADEASGAIYRAPLPR